MPIWSRYHPENFNLGRGGSLMREPSSKSSAGTCRMLWCLVFGVWCLVFGVWEVDVRLPGKGDSNGVRSSCSGSKVCFSWVKGYRLLLFGVGPLAPDHDLLLLRKAAHPPRLVEHLQTRVNLRFSSQFTVFLSEFTSQFTVFTVFNLRVNLRFLRVSTGTSTPPPPPPRGCTPAPSHPAPANPVLNLRTTTSQKCAAVPRRARI